MSSAKKAKPMVDRSKNPSPFITVAFVGLRGLDIVLQYYILTDGWGQKLIGFFGGHVNDPMAPAGVNWFQFYGLTPYYALIISMAVGSTIKQSVYAMFVTENTMSIPFIFTIAAVNSVLNSLNTLLSLWTVSSNAPAQQSSRDRMTLDFNNTFYIGLALYALGMIFELFSELQRTKFKMDPVNRGKVYAGGLFSLAININYGGYMLWRAGYAACSGGLLWGAVVGGFMAYNFITMSIPDIDAYMTKRYGAQYTQVKARVKYRLLPYVY